MIEKVNPSHPDKIADRIAGAIVDLAYKKQDDPKIAVEILIGHGMAHIIIESSVGLDWNEEIERIVKRIAYGCADNEDTNDLSITGIIVPQDPELAKNQENRPHCGDNGIFKGVPTNQEEQTLSHLVRDLYRTWPTDGKYLYDARERNVTACQSHAKTEEIEKAIRRSNPALFNVITVNPLGEWTGGLDTDTGATNRKLGSDMGRAVTGGGLHGKDLTKADVSVNIVCHILAEQYGREIYAACDIGDTAISFIDDLGVEIEWMTFESVMKRAKEYISDLGGFEKLAEWGLI